MSVVLVADDQPDIRLLARLVLQQAGHEVIEAASGRDTLDAVERQHVDVLVLDLEMPDVDGWQVLEELDRAGRLRSLAVVAVSAHGDPSLMRDAISRGCRDYVGKPYDPDSLVTAVAEAVALRG